MLRKARLARARQLLQTTDKNVSEVAYAVGFSTPSISLNAIKKNSERALRNRQEEVPLQQEQQTETLRKFFTKLLRLKIYSREKPFILLFIT